MQSDDRLGTLAWLTSTPAGTGILLAGIGFLVWISLSVVGGFVTAEPSFRLREAWDTAPYFYVGLPLMAVAAAVAGFARPEQVWRWPIWLVAGHQLGVVVLGVGMQSGPSLILLTAILAIVLVVLFAVPAALGAFASRHFVERTY